MGRKYAGVNRVRYKLGLYITLVDAEKGALIILQFATSFCVLLPGIPTVITI